MSKSKRLEKQSQKKVAAMAAGVSAEQAEIEAAIEKEIESTPAPVKRTVILPEGVTGADLKRKIILPQTAERAAKLIPDLQSKVDEAKEAARNGMNEKSNNVAKAKPAKTEKTDKTAKTTTTKTAKGEGKYANNITSMEKLGDWCLAQKFTEAEIEKVFIAGYALKSVTDMAFITPRIAIYMNIARKRAAKLNPVPAPEVKKEEVEK
jgi:hypothetical protein